MVRFYPTLSTLLRVAMVFGVGLEDFFAESKEQPVFAVVRHKERLRLPDRPQADQPSYLFESHDFPVANRKIEAFLAEFPAGSKPSPPHQHDGAELIYVIKGQLAVGIEGNETVLDEGDALYFESSVPHAYRREGPASCSAIVVVAPG